MDQRINVDDQSGPEQSVANLREQRGQLRHTDVSWDLSEVSFQTEQTEYRHSRHSSLNTEPLTLDVEQIHDAKTRYSDWRSKIFAWNLQIGALGNGLQDLDVQIGDGTSKDDEADIMAQQLDSLVEKTQHLPGAYGKEAIPAASTGVKSQVMDNKGEVVTPDKPDQPDVHSSATQTVEESSGRRKEGESV